MPGTHPGLIHANQARWELWMLFVISEVNTLSRRGRRDDTHVHKSTHSHTLAHVHTHARTLADSPRLLVAYRDAAN